MEVSDGGRGGVKGGVEGSGLTLAVTAPLFLLDLHRFHDSTDNESWLQESKDRLETICMHWGICLNCYVTKSGSSVTDS